MKKRSRQEIEVKARHIWPQATIEIAENNARWIFLTVSQMYESPGLSFSNLMELSEFFKTKSINDESRFNKTGCETCDYGNSYGFVLLIKPEAA